MKKKLLIAAIAMAVGFSACEKKQAIVEQTIDENLINYTEEVIPGSFIVLYDNTSTSFKNEAADVKSRNEMVVEVSIATFKEAGVVMRTPSQVYSSALKGLAVELSTDDVERLKKEPHVIGVYPDKMITLARPVPIPDDPPAQIVQFGVLRTGYATYTGSNSAWIIDTGIDLDHPDLNVDASRGYLAADIRSRVGFDDDNGHGTHCAGIVAAIDNEIGVVGVAAGAIVVPVKVLDRRGSGAYSAIIAGVDYVAANASPGDAANLSLGGGVYEPIDLAVQALGDAGVLVALAAGNESDDANNHSPARANGANLYTVSAMDINDDFAYFSNYANPPVDYCAPGVNIFSTYMGGAYATMSGTSMAAPHVCGLLLLTSGNLTSDGFVNGDPDGNPDAIAHN